MTRVCTIDTLQPFDTINTSGYHDLWYTVPPIIGGTTHGTCTVHRRAVPPAGVPGFDQPDPRRVSAAGAALRGRLPDAYGGVAPRREAPDGPSFQRIPELSLTNPGGSAAVYSGLCEDLLPAGGARAPVRHGPEQGQPVDPCPPPGAAGRPAHPR